MLTVTVNGEALEVADGSTLVDLVGELAGTARGSALVVDDEVVPRGQWPVSRLRAGQRIELITAVQGG